ncbi:MAG: MmcQ/YjbR family DNA-binding protein [Atopobiaceae bacterium]|nr:MmcQ/YjbR family DNA-binding protein [Atopobiaceae bacterium]
MTQAELSAYVLGHFDADSSHSFETDRSVTVYSRLDNRKWFAATKNIGWRYLGIDRAGRIDILNVKLAPPTVRKLRDREGFLPAWKMNQNNWITVLLDGSVTDEEIRTLLGEAFELAGIARGR